MKIQESFLTNQGLNKEHEWAEYKLFMDNKEVFSVKHDTNNPEDNTLFTNFKDCYNIVTLLQQVYEAGKNNVQVEFGLR